MTRISLSTLIVLQLDKLEHSSDRNIRIDSLDPQNSGRRWHSMKRYLGMMVVSNFVLSVCEVNLRLIQISALFAGFYHSVARLTSVLQCRYTSLPCCSTGHHMCGF